MSYLNKCLLIGKLGQDPEIKTFSNGTKVANLSLATTQSYKDKEGNWQNITEWHKITVFNANLITFILNKNLSKGTQIYVEGAIKNKKYTDSNNVVKNITEIVVSNYDGTIKILQQNIEGLDSSKEINETSNENDFGGIEF